MTLYEALNQLQANGYAIVRDNASEYDMTDYIGMMENDGPNVVMVEDANNATIYELDERGYQKSVPMLTVFKSSGVDMTYRAAYWTDHKGAEVVLTLPEHASMTDEELLIEAQTEAERQGVDLSYGEIIIGEWTQ